MEEAGDSPNVDTLSGGLILGASDDGSLVRYTGPAMGVTIGGVGSGKFTAAIAPNLLAYSGSCFVVDPSGEACAVTANARENHHGQTVYRLDPFNRTKFAPGSFAPPLASYNPLDALDSEAPDFIADVTALVEAIVDAPKGDPFWSNNAKELLTALIIFTCTHLDADGQRNLTRVYHYLSLDAAGNDWLLQEIGKSSFAEVRACCNAFQQMNEKTSEAMRQQARTEIRIFADPAIEKAASASSFDLEELFTGRCTVYLVMPPERLQSHKKWLHVMLTALFMAAVRNRQSNAVLPVLCLVDEAAQLGPLDAILKAYILMRGYGVRVWTFWQDLGQIQATYPKHWTSLLANSFIQVMSVGDIATAEYFAALSGRVDGTSQSHGASNSISGSSFSKTTTQSWSWQPNEKITVSDLFGMHRNQMYVRIPNGGAGFVAKQRYYENPALMALAMPNPYSM